MLQNIEFCIVEEYRADRLLLDMDARDAVDALVRHYRSEEEQRTPPEQRLSARAQLVFDNVLRICEWRLGRIELPGDPVKRIPISELVRCLRKIQKSIQRWGKQRGNRGYLEFVSPYMP